MSFRGARSANPESSLACHGFRIALRASGMTSSGYVLALELAGLAEAIEIGGDVSLITVGHYAQPFERATFRHRLRRDDIVGLQKLHLVARHQQIRREEA